MAQPWARPFYQSKVWRQQRQHALNRDRYSCRDCGGRAEEVHHVVVLTPTNIADPRVTLDLGNLVSLCHDCHVGRHAGGGAVGEGFVFDEAGQLVRG